MRIEPALQPARHAAMAARQPELVIGLVSILPPAKVRLTERHYQAVLNAASPGQTIRLRRFTLPCGDLHQQDEHLDMMWDNRLDGLIVAGTEPRAAAMADEPCWPALARLVDWAGEHTLSTIWSCFSAHAAVYRLDGIARQPLPQKLSGVFRAAKATPHGVLRGLTASYDVPHSRRNTLDAAALRQHGYTILSGSPQLGPDVFAKPHGGAEFLFLQGHLEYAPRTLATEYFRDIGRFVSGQYQAYPPLPENYFDPASSIALRNLQTEFSPAAYAAFDWAGLKVIERWQLPARRLYAGWLAAITARKTLAAELPG